MKNIIISGHAGMGHMLCSCNFAFNLSDKLSSLGIENKVYHRNWHGWESFSRVFNISHPNFSSKNEEIDDALAARGLDWAVYGHQVYKRKGVNGREITSKISRDYIEELSSMFLKTKDFNENICVSPDQTDDRDLKDFFNLYGMQPYLQTQFQDMYNLLNKGNYVGIHVRGSDRIFNKNESYEDFLAVQVGRINKILIEVPDESAILIASDNQDILKRFVDNRKIFSASIAYHLYKKGISLPASESSCFCKSKNFWMELGYEREQVSGNALLDFYLLAKSRKFYASEYSGWAGMINKLMKAQAE